MEAKEWLVGGRLTGAWIETPMGDDEIGEVASPSRGVD